MNTLLLHPEDAGAIEQAGAMLASGQVVGIPTETVYGLGRERPRRERCAPDFRRQGSSDGQPADRSHRGF